MNTIDLSTLDVEALKKTAAAYHKRGFNCAQSVACAYAPLIGVDTDLMFRMTEGFGAGMGGMTETCGAISGAVTVLGCVMSSGADNPGSKKHTYKLSHELCDRFLEKNKSTICYELKGVGTGTGPLRSCPGCIEDAIEILADILRASQG